MASRAKHANIYANSERFIKPNKRRNKKTDQGFNKKGFCPETKAISGDTKEGSRSKKKSQNQNAILPNISTNNQFSALSNTQKPEDGAERSGNIESHFCIHSTRSLDK